MKLGILGGTFDPIHYGHLTLAEEARLKLELDKIVFIPTNIPPHKGEREITPAVLRYKMVNLAIKNNPYFELSDIEIRRGNVSYTVDTLKQLHGEYPKGTEFYFITGSDSLSIIDSWKDPEEIFKLCVFVVAKRPGFQLKKELPYGSKVIEITPVDVSSSEVREMVKKGESISSFVPTKVVDFIEKNGLYKE